jgi:hypothetical protein
MPEAFAHRVVMRNFKIHNGAKMVINKGVPEVTPSFDIIGVSGSAGFGVGLCPEADLPTGFSGMAGYTDPSNDNYGNYTYTDGSVMVFIPKFYYKVGTGSNGLAVNVIDVKGVDTYASTAAATAAGYALHRAFSDGGREKSGFFVDKYMCSNNGGVASSIQNGNPLSTHADHNPISGLTVSPTNNYAGTIDAAKGRGEIFNVASRFIYAALAILSMAHGQAATGTDYCAWYDAGGTTNFPKGLNNNQAPSEGTISNADVNDNSVSYTSDGYSNCGQTGSGTPFAKTTHNGQNSGVADLNGVMWEVSLGLTRPGTNATDDTEQNDATAFYVLKEAVALKDLTSGWHSGAEGASYQAWGDANHLANYYNQITISHINDTASMHRFGNAANQVLSEEMSGTNWLYTGLGFPKDDAANGPLGTSLFGNDYFFESHIANLTVLSSGYWGSTSGAIAGVWYVLLSDYRSWSEAKVGFRAACYPDNGILIMT